MRGGGGGCERKCGVGTSKFPAVDIFVTTADPVLEPPLITINTVLSLLAVDYPANKLACYVSDDGASIVTYYSLVEASKFAKHWVPFCKKYNIALRAPFRYFSGNSSPPQDSSQEFQQDWTRMKDEYKQLCKKIEDASNQEPETCDFDVFSNIQQKNHPTIIKVILENKEGVADGLPHLVYISREKRPKHPHQFKAGAMNVLTRVSGVMTNAPFMLNVDCDMYANNPQVVLHAMCYFLGAKDEIDCGFVQFPQFFYDGLKEDPYGNQLKVLHEYFGRGISGIQGPFYQGSGCFHRRKVIYGSSPYEKITAGELKDEYIQKTYGMSEKLSTSIAKTLLEGSNIIEQFNSDSPSSSIEIAHQVGSCGFEFGTAWGQKLGWLYGSVAEDILTGLFIQSRGWKSAYCLPDPPAFLGCAPAAGPASMIQQKRWATGLFEVLLNSKSPIIGTLFGKLQLRQCMAYLQIQLWGLRSIFEVCYAILPAYCLITNSHFLPQMVSLQISWCCYSMIVIFVEKSCINSSSFKFQSNSPSSPPTQNQAPKPRYMRRSSSIAVEHLQCSLHAFAEVRSPITPLFLMILPPPGLPGLPYHVDHLLSYFTTATEFVPSKRSIKDRKKTVDEHIHCLGHLFNNKVSRHLTIIKSSTTSVLSHEPKIGIQLQHCYELQHSTFYSSKSRDYPR
ncbi:hypothetical protein KY290_032793 [Solanum tuberosum]|uniref:Cellulose synthase n=1 Tax=Solanum tuberosum TaxID=4113 RepID=A0ABQ7UGE0_SOLTU|nr:hypothetical protein KY290_032793 [Solanum tuberosum]